MESTRARHLALLALTVLALWLCFLVARPFVSALAWAMALAVATYPLHRRIARRIHNETWAAAVSIFLVLIVLLAPLGGLLPIAINGAIDGVNAIRSQIESGEWKSNASSHTWLWPAWLWLEKRVDLGDAIQRVAALVTALASYLLQGSLLGVLEILVVFFLLFYFFRDRVAILATIRSLLPLASGESDKLFGVVANTVYATIYGKLAVGLVQGFLGGLMFWWLGLTAPWFWAIVMGIFSIIPVVGPSLIWLPAAIILFIDGSWMRGTILVTWGSVVVASIDNLAYPILVQNKLQLHTVPVFITMVGGVVVFGPAGFFLGPVILAVTLSLLDIWKSKADPELSLFPSRPGAGGPHAADVESKFYGPKE